eukprot:SAG31_NODE_19177_length_610_cov_0.804305_1_plen_174_part_10
MASVKLLRWNVSRSRCACIPDCCFPLLLALSTRPGFNRRQGTLFDVACTPHPLCVPARCSFWCSQYAHTTGCRRNETLLPVRVDCSSWLRHLSPMCVATIRPLIASHRRHDFCSTGRCTTRYAPMEGEWIPLGHDRQKPLLRREGETIVTTNSLTSWCIPWTLSLALILSSSVA